MYGPFINTGTNTTSGFLFGPTVVIRLSWPQQFPPPPPPPPPPRRPALSWEQAMSTLFELAEMPLEEPAPLRRVYRRAVLRHHPDRGGERAAWDRLDVARRVLGL